MKISLFTTLAVLLATAAAAPTTIAKRDPPGGKKVFAHYMLGVTSGQRTEHWFRDISDAKRAGIDGFALNAGPEDSYSMDQLQMAYAAAEALDFKLFISFDMNEMYVDKWSVQQVADWVNRFKNSGAQFKVDGKPFVSTFEGPRWADKWAAVKQSAGDIYFVPDWSSIGPDGVAGHLDKIDGAFSWDAWNKHPVRKTTETDEAYKRALGPNKSYMMPVSPFFYSNVPEYGKNWLWPSDHLWFDRLEQMLTVNPDFVELLTWNDFGEGHYMTTQWRDEAIVEGAKWWARGVPHGALRAVLPYYIKSYKAGQRLPVEEDVAVFWYRNTPKSAGHADGTMCGQENLHGDATNCVSDAVFVMVLSTQAQTMHVNIGGQGQTFELKAGSNMVEMPFNGRTGDVEISLVGSGKSAKGPTPITNSTPDGRLNFNYFVGSTERNL